MTMQNKQYIFFLIFVFMSFTVLQFITLSHTNKLLVYFLDVGQGDSALIKFPSGEKLLIDTGKDSKVLRELDKVLPWYDKKIDYVLLSHGDIDHVGAMIDLFNRYKIKRILVNDFFGEIEIEKEILKYAQIEGSKIEKLKTNDIITFGIEINNNLKIIHPESNCLDVYKNENDCSLVALITYGENTFLFTGDIGKEVEKNILNQIKNPISVLKVAHHGSRFSTDQEFIQKIKPQYSIVSVGENSYGHPHQDVIAILNSASSTIFSTKEADTIVAASNGKDLKVNQLFDQSRFFQSSICSILLYSFDTSC